MFVIGNVIGIVNYGFGRNDGPGTTFIMDVLVTIDTLGKVYYKLKFTFSTHEEMWTKVISL